MSPPPMSLTPSSSWDPTKCVRSREVLAHWTDQLGVWLDDRDERERLATAEREREEKEKEERELEVTAAREQGEKEEEEREATAREEEGRETTTAKVEIVEEAATEAQRVPLTGVSEPQTATSRAPKSPAKVTPAVLRCPYAPAPIEIASLELVQEPAQQSETTAQVDEGEPSTEEQQSRVAEVELEQCLAAMGEPSPPPTPTSPVTQPPVAKPAPKAPAAMEIPMWAEIRLRHDTGSKQKAYNPRRQMQLDDYEPQQPLTAGRPITPSATHTASTSRSTAPPSARPIKVTGVIFGGLRPIAVDPARDPPGGHCFNCWQHGHSRGDEIANCPRCGERYRARQQEWEARDSPAQGANGTQTRGRSRTREDTARELQQSPSPATRNRRKEEEEASAQRMPSPRSQLPVPPIIWRRSSETRAMWSRS